MAGRAVVVLGGGVGGVVAANELRRRLDPADRVIVVERERRHLFQPSLLWLMVGRRRPDQIVRPLRELLAPGVELVEAEVRSIDPVARRVETTAGVLEGDAIVVALGAEPDRDAIPGYREEVERGLAPDGATACARALDGFDPHPVPLSRIGTRIGVEPPQERSALPHQVEPVVTEESAADLAPSAAVGEISGQRPLHRSQPHSTTDTDTQEGTR